MILIRSNWDKHTVCMCSWGEKAQHTSFYHLIVIPSAGGRLIFRIKLPPWQLADAFARPPADIRATAKLTFPSFRGQAVIVRVLPQDGAQTTRIARDEWSIVRISFRIESRDQNKEFDYKKKNMKSSWTKMEKESHNSKSSWHFLVKVSLLYSDDF